jgi:hypothetical protein
MTSICIVAEALGATVSPAAGVAVIDLPPWPLAAQVPIGDPDEDGDGYGDDDDDDDEDEDDEDDDEDDTLHVRAARAIIGRRH